MGIALRIKFMLKTTSSNSNCIINQITKSLSISIITNMQKLFSKHLQPQLCAVSSTAFCVDLAILGLSLAICKGIIYI